MSSNLEQTTLGSIADILMGQSPPGETCNQKGLGIPLLNGPSEFGSYHPTPIQFTTDSRKLAKKNDLLFCVRGSTTGRMNWADQNYSIGRGLAALRHKRGLEYQPYLKALLETLLPDLLGSATGSTFPNVSRDQLTGAKIFMHSPDQQLAISTILSSLDDKIELNRQICKTLEDIASTLFKSWFIDFDPVKAKAAGRAPEGLSPEIAELFPNSLVELPLGKIPKHWKLASLSTEFDLLMGQSPPGNTYNEISEGLPFFQGTADFGFRFPSNRIFCNKPNRIATTRQALVSVRAPVGEVNVAIENCCIGRGVASVNHKSGSSSYTFYMMKALKNDFKSFEANGTVFGSIKKNEFENIKLIVPDQLRLIKEFENIAGIIDKKIETLSKHTLNLCEIRNFLLPGLISDSIRLKDI